MGTTFSRTKVDEADYEKILAELDAKIRKAEMRLAAAKSRERMNIIRLLLYSTLIYVVYLGAFFVYIRKDVISWEEWLIKASPVVGGPVLIFIVKSLISLWYRRQQSQEESQLTAARAQQKLKVEELKKKTAYYTTKSLLERYDLATPRAPKIQQSFPSVKNAPAPRQFGLSQPVVTVAEGAARGGPVGSNMTGMRQRIPQTTLFGQSQSKNFPSTQQMTQQNQPIVIPYGGTPVTPDRPIPNTIPPTTAGTTERRWYDKLVDVIVGDEGPETKFALICEHCFAHNGLVLPVEVDDIQYICPKCNHFNPSRRKRRLAATSGLQNIISPPSPLQDINHSRENSPNSSSPSSPSLIRRGTSVDRRGRSLTPRALGPNETDGVSNDDFLGKKVMEEEKFDGEVSEEIVTGKSGYESDEEEEETATIGERVRKRKGGRSSNRD